MEDFNATVVFNIVRIRTSKKMTAEQLAFNSDLSKGTISKIENFKMNPSLNILIKISKTLGIHPSELFQ